MCRSDDDIDQLVRLEPPWKRKSIWKRTIKKARKQNQILGTKPCGVQQRMIQGFGKSYDEENDFFYTNRYFGCD